jgi:hypothetical protein
MLVKGSTKLLVCHSCNNPLCCNPAHLYAGTHSDNTQQCHDDGRAFCIGGANNGNAKLTVDDVRQIRDKYSDGVRQCELIKLFNVSSANMSNICNGHTWKHLE